MSGGKGLFSSELEGDGRSGTREKRVEVKTGISEHPGRSMVRKANESREESECCLVRAAMTSWEAVVEEETR